MAVSYKKLWKMLIDKDMKEKASARKPVSVGLRHQDGQRRPRYHRGACQDMYRPRLHDR